MLDILRVRKIFYGRCLPSFTFCIANRMCLCVIFILSKENSKERERASKKTTTAKNDSIIPSSGQHQSHNKSRSRSTRCRSGRRESKDTKKSTTILSFLRRIDPNIRKKARNNRKSKKMAFRAFDVYWYELFAVALLTSNFYIGYSVLCVFLWMFKCLYATTEPFT